MKPAKFNKIDRLQDRLEAETAKANTIKAELNAAVAELNAMIVLGEVSPRETIDGVEAIALITRGYSSQMGQVMFFSDELSDAISAPA